MRFWNGTWTKPVHSEFRIAPFQNQKKKRIAKKRSSCSHPPHSPAAHTDTRHDTTTSAAAAAAAQRRRRRPPAAAGPVLFQPPGTMSSGLDMSLEDLIKQSKSKPKSNPASSSGPARRAPPAARAAPYPPVATKVRAAPSSPPGSPPPENPNAAAAAGGPCARSGPPRRHRLALRDLLRAHHGRGRAAAGGGRREVAGDGDEAAHLQPWRWRHRRGCPGASRFSAVACQSTSRQLVESYLCYLKDTSSMFFVIKWVQTCCTLMWTNLAVLMPVSSKFCLIVLVL